MICNEKFHKSISKTYINITLFYNNFMVCCYFSDIFIKLFNHVMYSYCWLLNSFFHYILANVNN